MRDTNLMIANALNNMFAADHDKTVVFMTEEQAKGMRRILGRHEFHVVALDMIPKETQLKAMHRYLDTTDWSAFTKADWRAAMATLH